MLGSDVHENPEAVSERVGLDAEDAARKVGAYSKGMTQRLALAMAVSNRVSGAVPFYLKLWFAALALGLWAVIPTGIGYWRFERSDL